MADANISLVLERLRELFYARPVKLSGIKGRIDGIMAELEQMRCFLKDADAYVKRNGDADDKVMNLVSKTMDTVFLIDCVLSRLTFKLPSSSSKRKGESFIKLLIKRFLWIFNGRFKCRKFKLQLDELRTKVAHLRLGLQDLGIKELRDEGLVGEGFGVEKHRAVALPRSDNDFAGFDKKFDHIVTDLMKESDSTRVVSICGLGGIGKTTLASEIYQDSQIKRHFDSLAWVTLSQDFDTKNILQKLLIQLISATNEERKKISAMDSEKIAGYLSTELKGKSFLLVLDDVWNTEVWDCLVPVFLNGKTSNSKILITTHNEEVAHQAAVNHDLVCLDEDESFKLLQKILITNCNKEVAQLQTDVNHDELTNSKLNENRINLAKKMLKHCSGLPLSICVIVGLVSTRSTTDDLKKLSDVFKTYLERYRMEDGQEELKHLGLSWLLNLIYDDLPSYLKPCLLYFCLFPKAYEIKVSHLCQLWIAEGFVSSSPWRRGNSFETLEDVAYGCLCELVRRHIVQVEDSGSTGRIRTCRMHDVIRDFCLSKASNDNFLQSVVFSSAEKNVLQFNQFQRLAVSVDCHASPMTSFGNNNNIYRYGHLRSFTCTNLLPPQLKQVWKPLIDNYHLLRVLKLENLRKLVQLPKSIGKLRDLRFFSIKGSGVEQISSSIGYLRYLQTLDLRSTSRLTLPNVIYKLKELRHLYLPCECTVNADKLFLNGLSSLQTLNNIPVDCCLWNSLACLTNLRRLKMYVDRNLGESYQPTRVTFNHLEFLSLKNYNGSISTRDIVPIILRYPRTYEIHVGLPIEKLPQDDQISPNLVKLTLKNTSLMVDPMAILQKLPNLRILHLDHNAFLGFEMVCSKGGFRQLESLSLVELLHLEKLWVENGAFPSLCHLNIKCCQRLMTIPDGLQHVTTLKEIMIQKMPMEFKNRVGDGGEDFYKVKHVPTLLFINT
ncbi:probable disease resistance RPP8-like protein 2 [Humulus lupulus]|uniref:probable disease resistance RPP8-like protein 2 n=1 Tax=Humulus lupulus TaxID=3486 RepID=UPI002B41748D|nr:probable disease resistance RPP8-like protein 2 [Humulus lupulus]XP_062077149.1 probable disease resistance RPP8-like protein 2 [Humulus lupulus]XP_062077150.1 probable disease resistance RPP8-like protein 2 [Humulus lupulus]